MKLNKTLNAKRNVVWGIAANFVSIILPFFVRTVIIRQLGANYCGLSSLFASILSVLNLTELGLSEAIVFCMYKPLAQDDNQTICALYNYFRKVYKVVGATIFGLGLLLIPFLHYFIKSDIPQELNIFVLHLMFLLDTSLSYLLFAYKNSIINLHQRNDIASKIKLAIKLLTGIGQILVIYLYGNYYLYVAVLLGNTIINNIITSIVVDKVFPQYKCEGSISNELKASIKEKICGLALARTTTVTRNSLDSIIASAYLGLTSVAILNNYYYVQSAITSFMHIFTSSITAGIGNSIAIDSVEKNYGDLRKLNFLYMWLANSLACCMACFYQLFMRIWVGETCVLPNHTMFLFVLYFLFLKLGDVQFQYFSASGLWWKRKNFYIAEMVINILLNLILGYYFGLDGIVISTLFTIIFIGYVGSSTILFTNYFKKPILQYYKEHFLILLVGIIASLACFISSDHIFKQYGLLTGFIITLPVAILLPNLLMYTFYCKSTLFQESVSWLKPRLRRHENHTNDA